MTFNRKEEVEKLFGRAMQAPELECFKELISLGYANPIDIHREINRQIWGK